MIGAAGWIALALAAGGGQETGGLRPGETATELPAAAERDAREGVAGRLVDAVTALPVAGATLEAWTESWDAPARVVDRTSSLADGSFRILVADGEERAEKLRVRAAGYRSTTRSLSIEEELLLWPLGEPLVLRVLDPDLVPIEGARVTTHQTCAHEPPAVVGLSDALGRVTIPDFPPWHDSPDLDVRAPGHGMRAHLWAPQLYSAPERPDGNVVFLPRRPPVRLRLIAEDGTPLAGRRAVQGSAPEWEWAWTDADGRVSFRSSFDSRDVHVTIRDERGRLYVGGGELPQEGELALRVEGERGEPTDATATLVLESAPLETQVDDFVVRVFHEDGWTPYGLGEHRLPPGRVRVLAGAAFSGVRERVHELELAEGETRVLRLEPEPEPVLRIQPPARVHVQAGSDSITCEGLRAQEVSVPAGEPLTVIAERDGEVHRATLEALQEDAELVLGDETLWRAAPGAGIARARLRIAVVDAEGRPLPEARIATTTVLYPLEDGDEDGLAHTRELDLPPHAPAQVEVSASGFVPAGAEARAGAEGTETELVVRLTRRAALEVRGRVAALEAVGRRAEAAEGAAVLERLAPGPLQAVVLRPDESRVVLELELAAGERRVVTLR